MRLLGGVLAVVLSLPAVGDDFEPIKLTSWTALKYQKVVQQGLDYTCGAASIATLLQFYFGDSWQESTIIADTTARLNEQELADRIKNGFSMMDMKHTLVRMGYQAVGVKLSIGQAERLRGPVIILLHKPTTNHFVVLRGIKNGEAYIADPTMGNIRMKEEDLAAQWYGESLVVGKANTNMQTLNGLDILANEIYHAEFDAVRVWRYVVN